MAAPTPYFLVRVQPAPHPRGTPRGWGAGWAVCGKEGLRAAIYCWSSWWNSANGCNPSKAPAT
jgi:hypothetical protein